MLVQRFLATTKGELHATPSYLLRSFSAISNKNETNFFLGKV
jgi:hypothetical protein